MAAPSNDELDEFIEEALAEKLAVIHKIRRRMRGKSRILGFILVVIGLPTTCFVSHWYGADGGSFDPTAAWIPLAMIAGWVGLFFFVRSRYISEEIPFEYHTDVVLPLVHFVDPRLSHYTEKTLPADDLEDCPLIAGAIEKFEGGDFFEGELSGFEVRFGDVEVATDREPLQGLLFVAEFPDELDGVDQRAFEDKLGELAGAFEMDTTGRRLFAIRRDGEYFDRDPDIRSDDTSHLHRIGRELAGLIAYCEEIVLDLPSPSDSRTTSCDPPKSR